MNDLYILYLIFFLVFTEGFWERIGIDPSLFKSLIIIVFFALIIIKLFQKKMKFPPGGILILLYFVWSVLSAVINGNDLVSAFLYSRFVIFAYVLYLVVFNLTVPWKKIVNFNKFILVLITLQIVSAFYQVVILRERVEAYVGVMSVSGGTTATAFPLLMVAFIYSFYFFYPKIKNSFVLFFFVGVLLVGYASQKRAIFFYIPIFLIFSILFVGLYKRKYLKHILKKVTLIGLAIPIIVPIYFFGLKTSEGIYSGASSQKDMIKDSLVYAKDYELREVTGGFTTGRTGTSKKILNMSLSSGLYTLLFGLGPQSVIRKEDSMKYFKYYYGLVGWSRDVVATGWPAMLFLLFFFILNYKKILELNETKMNLFWLSIKYSCLLSFWVFLFIHMTYSADFAVSGKLSFIVFYFYALLLSPRHESARNTISRI